MKTDSLKSIDIICEVLAEIVKQSKMDSKSQQSINDLVAQIVTYAGRATETQANKNAGFSFRDNMVKIAAAAISAVDGYVETTDAAHSKLTDVAQEGMSEMFKNYAERVEVDA